jgi:nucleoside phosphorylase/DNA-directed RNA polymerase specialized sigma24 family protein
VTRFLSSEPPGTQGHLAALADAATRATHELGARIAVSLQQGEDLHAALAGASDVLGTSLSHEMIDLALSNAATTPVDARANKVAFLLLTTVPTSTVAQLLAAVSERAFRRAGPALGPFVDADDLHSTLRWRLWTLSADYFTRARILRHPGLAAFLSVIARRIVIDECRAMENRSRVGIEPESIEASVDPRDTLDAVLDDLDLLQRFANELPEWQAPIVELLAGRLDRDDALRSINRQREAAGLALWSSDALRTAVHRARKRLRVLITRAPSRMTPEPPQITRETAPVVHAWRRFWCARDGSYSLADDGFLMDPETEYGRHVHDIVALDRLTDVSCLVLLGEPGIGKSTVVQQEVQRLLDEGHQAVLIDLARTNKRDALHRAIERVCATSTSSGYLFFDALDEGLARNPALVSDLITVIDELDHSRVRLRITSRTLEWPQDFEAHLRKRFEGERLRIDELLPLRRIDVIAAANDHGVEGADFVRELRERDATSLAIRPISLRFLLAMFAADGALPHSRARLFDEGMLILCSEEGAFQRGRTRRNPDVYRRRAIAGRLAAASTFTNRHSIVRGQSGDNDVLPAKLVAGVIDKLSDATYAIDLSAVEDVLAGAALFTARSATSYGWSHQSYREFLSAWYLAQHRIAVESAERLYFPQGLARVPGPLREVAAWHATFAPELFDRIVERDPEVLLHSDGAAVSSEGRAQLVRALLDRMARHEALDSSYYRRDYQKLAHPNLAPQLRPYIIDRHANIIVRRAAMDIAWACRVTDVIEDLIAVVVDRNDELLVREVAGRALAQLGGDRVRDAFVALLSAGFDPDPNDNIRGSVLSFLWPNHIDAPTLFRHLTIPRRDDYVGNYQRFIAELAATLQPDHILLALAWVESVKHRRYDVERAQHDIIDISLRYIEREDIRAALVRIIRPALKTHRGAWYAHGSHRERGERVLAARDRRLIARDLIQLAHDDEQLGHALVFFDPPLIGPDDLGWIAELARVSEDDMQRVYGRCIAAIYMRYGYPVDPLAADAVVSIESPSFREPLQPFLEPVEMGSARARDLAERWAYVHRSPSEVTDSEQPQPTRWAIVGPLLERVEAGDLHAWVELVFRWKKHVPKPIADSVEWTKLAPHEHERILLAALRYVQGFDPPDLAWLDVPNEFPWTAVAARSALQLIAAVRPALLDAIPAPAWRRWCPVLVALTFPSITPTLRAELVRRCASFNELATTVVRVARRDNDHGAHVSVFSELPDPLPDPLQEAVSVIAPELGDDAFEDAIRLLVRAGNEVGRDLARAAVRDAPPERATRAARVLLPHDGTQWSVVVARMQRERAFVDAFVPLVSHGEDREDDPFATLTEQEAADIYLTLLRQYPPDDDARRPLDRVERLRWRMIDMLVAAGNDAAIRALEWLRDQEPEDDTVRYRLVEARKNQADVSWAPLSIEALWQALGADVAAPVGQADDTLDALPAIVMSSPLRRDATRAQISELLANVHVLVETATKVETAAVHSAMSPLPAENALVAGSVGIATYTIGMFGRYAVAHFQSDMGNESPNAAQLATNDALVDTRPQVVILVGIAFGLQPTKQRLGDVLVAQYITSYEMVKVRPDALEERGETLRADAALVERIHAHGRTWTFPRADGSQVAFHVGQVLSGAKLVNNREFRDALVRRFPSALGGEMEGIGAYGAAFRQRVPVLLVKGICDWADGTKNDRAQPFAAAAATDLVRHILAKPDALAALGVTMAV